jgi:hypothetical protein
LFLCFLPLFMTIISLKILFKILFCMLLGEVLFFSSFSSSVLVLSYLILSYLILSYLILSYLILSYLIISFLSYLIFLHFLHQSSTCVIKSISFVLYTFKCFLNIFRRSLLSLCSDGISYRSSRRLV